MNKYLIFTLIACLMTLQSMADGVAIVDATNGVYLQLTESQVEVTVNNQIAIVTTTHKFYNQTGQPTLIKYGFPMHAEASAINLKWRINGVWFEAAIEAQAQNDTLPGDTTGGSSGGTDPNLLQYLGDSPLFFGMEDTVQTDSTLIFSLTYVELLPYDFGKVSFHYPHQYTLIQSQYLDQQELTFKLISDRTITAIQWLSHAGSITNSGDTATATFFALEMLANNDYEIEYELSSTNLGVFDLSTHLPDSLSNCDSFGNGFTTFIIEPESNPSSGVIEKNFVLVIDRSGSMSGNKIVQARDAASFIVDHLNLGDKFNIVDFNSSVSQFKPQLVEVNTTHQLAALNYIGNMDADGGTNISGALTTAIGQFGAVDSSKANIIIFFTDGQATAGITSTPGILTAVENAVNSAETQIFLFNFGIGNNVDLQLLTLLALENSGLATFLGNNQLEDEITKFFLRINNPVLLHTDIAFTPPVIDEIYPSPLPNLYKGQQLIIVGRYDSAQAVSLQLSGNAFNLPVSYTYNISLADSQVTNLQFLPKVWAKRKIDALTLDYYILPAGSPQRDSLQEAIEDLSVCYGLISPFTSFAVVDTGGINQTEIEEELEEKAKYAIEAYPNPFLTDITFRIEIPFNLHEDLVITIYDALGRKIQVITQYIPGAGEYEIHWDGLDQYGVPLPVGRYYCAFKIGEDMQTMSVVKAN
jgi:Ca-activated chloride channel family protein